MSNAQHSESDLRESERNHLWDVLEESSVLLVGPRRIGKTTLIRDAICLPRRNAATFRGVRVDVEYSTSVENGVEKILAGLATVRLTEPTADRLKQNISTANLGPLGVELRPDEGGDPWKRLGRVLAEAAGRMGSSDLLLLGLDEVPWWLDSIRKRAGPEAAREVLAALRYLRQRDDLQGRLRMVLTSSIGLAGLAQSIGASAEMDDLEVIELGPMTHIAGTALFEAEVARKAACTPEAATMAFEMAGGSPHWIKEVATRSVAAAGADRVVDVGQVHDAVTALLDPKMRNLFADEGHEHLLRRHADQKLVLSRLLALAAQRPEGAPREGLIAVALEAGIPSRRKAEELIYLLVDEFYLRHEASTDSFRFILPLFQRWWLWYGDEL